MREQQTDTHVARAATDDEIQALIAELQTLRHGETTVAKLVACGRRAIRPLQALLFHGKPSSLYQPRQLAVEALADLGAQDVLMTYLRLPKDIPDAMARFGEEAVESTAARLLATWRTDDVFAFLLALARERTRVGLIQALGAFRRPEALPLLEQALADDYYRPAAEEALWEFGPDARDTLLRAVVTPWPNRHEEAPASLRRRRSAAGLLAEIGIAPEDRPVVRPLLAEEDPDIVVAACKLLIVSAAPPTDRRLIARRLLEILPTAGWHLQDEIGACLVALGPECWPMVEDAIARRLAQTQEQCVQGAVAHALLRVKRHLEASGYAQ
jgi:hypothetical protein